MTISLFTGRNPIFFAAERIFSRDNDKFESSPTGSTKFQPAEDFIIKLTICENLVIGFSPLDTRRQRADCLSKALKLGCWSSIHREEYFP